MVFIRKKTNIYIGADGKKRIYTYGILVRSRRIVAGEPPSQQVIKYLGRDFDPDEVMRHADAYVREFDTFERKANALLSRQDMGLSPMEFYIAFIETYLLANGFCKENGVLVRKDIHIAPAVFSVTRSGKPAHVRIGDDIYTDEFLRDIYAKLKSMRKKE